MSTILKETEPKARKDHVCDWCGNKIKAGTKYFYQVCTVDGDFQTVKYHPECKDIVYGLIAEIPTGQDITMGLLEDMHFEKQQNKGGYDEQG